jgi:hypothetical protein
LAAIALIAGSRWAGAALAGTGEQPARRRAGAPHGSSGRPGAEQGAERHGRHEAMTHVMPAGLDEVDERAAY